MFIIIRAKSKLLQLENFLKPCIFMELKINGWPKKQNDYLWVS